MKRLTTFFLLATALAGGLAAQDAASTSPPLLFIFDASGSMWGQVEGENKIVIARRVFRDLVEDLPDDSEVGLIAYGHRREGDCDDIETIVPIGPLQRAPLIERVDGIDPKGKTPITKSVSQAFEAVRNSARNSTIILVSDGLETCGGDPCAAVRLAKAEGLDFVMHVVGFDVAGEDVSQLECAAQAGGGLFMSADNATGLGEALEAAVAMPADIPPGRLVLRATANGELQDVAVVVTDSETGKKAADGRTYTRPDTNPRELPLADGTYDVVVTSIGIKGDRGRRFQIEIVDGSTVEKEVDYSTGELAIGVTRNGERSDAVYRIYAPEMGEEVASGRTYTSEKANPAVKRITAGTYEVRVDSVEISGGAEVSLGTVTVEPGGRSEISHDFVSGTLRVGVVQGAELVDAVVRVVDIANGKQVAQARTYTSDNSNPKSFVIEPGTYRVEAGAVKLEGRPKREFEVTIEAGTTSEHTVDFGS